MAENTYVLGMADMMVVKAPAKLVTLGRRQYREDRQVRGHGCASHR